MLTGLWRRYQGLYFLHSFFGLSNKFNILATISYWPYKLQSNLFKVVNGVETPCNNEPCSVYDEGTNMFANGQFDSIDSWTCSGCKREIVQEKFENEASEFYKIYLIFFTFRT